MGTELGVMGGRHSAGAPVNEGAARQGVTVVELLVIIGIVSLLAALLLPAVQQSRESARRIHCSDNLRQIGVACGCYHEVYGFLTPGNNGFSLHVTLLPWLEQRPLWEQVNFKSWGGSHKAAAIYSKLVPVFACPSDRAVVHRGGMRKATSYAGCFGSGVQAHGYNGLFRRTGNAPPPYLTGPLTIAAVIDGLSNTAAVAEILAADGS